MDVEQIRKKIKETYDSFESYQDSGVIISENFETGNGWFTTYFLRPNQLIFEFSNRSSKTDKQTLMVKGNECQLVGSGKNEYKASEPKGFAEVQRVMKDRWPLSGLGGVTAGMSDTILPMLIKDSGRSCFIDNKLALMKDEVIDDTPCYHIREILHPHHIWVSKDDFTVRRTQDYGYAPINEIQDGAIRLISKVSQFFTGKNPLEKELSILYKLNDIDWQYTHVQYNHLNADTFPTFQFKDIATPKRANKFGF